MKKKLTTVEFHGTAEQEEKLLAVIEKYNGTQGAMMPILQEAQGIYGYLPRGSEDNRREDRCFS